jgi:hypothetical protein
MPVVTVAVAPSSVSEDGAANLVYTFTRSGSTASPLTVNYTVGGTATIGSDYTGIATAGTTKAITFAAGSATVAATVDPTADTTAEANETVTLTLATNSGYTIGGPNAATGTITNDDAAPPVSGLPFPTGWNDPIFAAATQVRTYIAPSSGQVVQDLTLDKGGQNGAAGSCLDVFNNCTVRRVRINAREGVRGGRGNVDVSNVYVQVFANGAAGDHADCWQNYTPENTSINDCTITLRNSHLRCSTSAGSNAAFFSGNDWAGRIVMENVWLAGGGFTAYFGSDNRSSVRTLSSIDLKNVYFEENNWMFGPLHQAIFWPTIIRWENVCVAKIVNGAIQIIRQIPRPAQ